MAPGTVSAHDPVKPAPRGVQKERKIPAVHRSAPTAAPFLGESFRKASPNVIKQGGKGISAFIGTQDLTWRMGAGGKDGVCAQQGGGFGSWSLYVGRFLRVPKKCFQVLRARFGEPSLIPFLPSSGTGPACAKFCQFSSPSGARLHVSPPCGRLCTLQRVWGKPGLSGVGFWEQALAGEDREWIAGWGKETEFQVGEITWKRRGSNTKTSGVGQETERTYKKEGGPGGGKKSGWVSQRAPHFVGISLLHSHVQFNNS